MATKQPKTPPPPKAPKTPKATAAAAPAATAAPAAEKPTEDTAQPEAKPLESAEVSATAVQAKQHRIMRLDQARNLPEAPTDAKSKPASAALTDIEAFKSEDGRTMNVVMVAGALAQQEVVR